MSTMGTPDTNLKNRTQQSPLASQRAKQGARPNGIEPNGPKAAYFPLGYKDGLSQWWASISPAAAEHKVLSLIPYLQSPPTHTETGSASPSTNASSLQIQDDSSHKASPVTTNTETDPYGPRRWHSALVKLSGKNRALNEFSVERVGENISEHCVMLPGYGAGLAFYYKNFEAMSRPKGWKLWSLDLLGMGRSSRPPFLIHAKDQKGKIAEAEDWFIDALEEWRVQKKIDKFTLLGHSLGGYMAVAYALKYPGHLKKLILASPVGIPEDPYAVNAAMPEPRSSTMANEFSQDQDSTTRSNADNNNFLNARNRAEKDAAKAGEISNGTQPAPRRPLPKWFAYLWDANLSPFSIVRWGGPLGPRFVSGWTSRRFSHLPAEDSKALHDYSYSLFRQRGSGEFALAYILAPGAFARSPLIRRIQGVGRQSLPTPPSADPDNPPPKMSKELGIPIVFLYGENDWMDIAGGYAAEEKLKQEKKRIMANASPEDAKLDKGSAKVLVVQKAGHHLYLDGWEQFNELMVKEMEDVSARKDL
ncbi:MAG: hypothetical protein M1814_002774 [Vezdaea aestivalis]|nr:MAG: hypothetical protein M1814_002774 [Vezdaea aestivalis]